MYQKAKQKYKLAYWYATVSYWCRHTASPSFLGRNGATRKVHLIKRILLLIYTLANFLCLATTLTTLQS